MYPEERPHLSHSKHSQLKGPSPSFCRPRHCSTSSCCAPAARAATTLRGRHRLGARVVFHLREFRSHNSHSKSSSFWDLLFSQPALEPEIVVIIQNEHHSPSPGLKALTVTNLSHFWAWYSISKYYIYIYIYCDQFRNGDMILLKWLE